MEETNMTHKLIPDCALRGLDRRARHGLYGLEGNSAACWCTLLSTPAGLTRIAVTISIGCQKSTCQKLYLLFGELLSCAKLRQSLNGFFVRWLVAHCDRELKFSNPQNRMFRHLYSPLSGVP
jgi:hypothetical protein